MSPDGRFSSARNRPPASARISRATGRPSESIRGRESKAAKEQDKWAIGVDKDQNFLAPDNVLTSAMKRVDNAVFAVSEMLAEEKFPGGDTILFSLENGGVGLAPTSNKHVPADLLAEVSALEPKIISGDIMVPFDAASYAEFGYE